MIAYFPEIYPDELLYSQLARYMAHTGYLAYIYAAEDLFSNKATRPDIEFLNQYTKDALCMITKDLPLKTVIAKHTMFPYYGRFLPVNRRLKALLSLVSMRNDYKDNLSIPARKDAIPRKIRYCPLCVNEDRKRFGETYWHRTHQMVGVNICHIHNCYLVETDILMTSKASPSLINAESIVKQPHKIIFSDSKTECCLARYIAEVFQSNVNLHTEIAVGKFLHSKMENTKYLSTRGGKRNMALLYADFLKYYNDLPRNEFNQQWQLQKVFNGNRYNTFEICLIALFLGISANELVEMRIPAQSQVQLFDSKIMELHRKGLNYQQISAEMNTSYNTVKAIGEGLYQKYHYYSDTPQKTGAKKYDWETIDAATLPLVKNLICKLRGDTSIRPAKITVGMIERHLGLPKKGLQNCPKCRAEILRYSESQEQFWARELIWAVNAIIDQGNSLNITQIMKITNMRKKNIVACLPYLSQYANADTVSLIKSIT